MEFWKNYRWNLILPQKIKFMLPDRCSVKHSGKDCVNPPEFVIEIVHENDSFMVGITCNKHKILFQKKL